MANTNVESSSSPFFSGNIGDAIVHSKSQNCPLVVAIHGDDNDSKRLDGETWSNEQIIALLGKESVALKLLWNTDDAKNFYSIYPVLNVPTVYIISPTNGSPLKVLTGFFDSQSFLNSFNESKELLKKGNTAPITPSPTVSPSAVTPPTQPFNSNNNAQPAVNTQPGTLSKEEQQRRMREKLEEIKRQKEEEERKAEKEREMARRQSGKELQKTVTQIKQNQQAKDIQERQREKEEEKVARQKVKEQLERDKAERKARMEQSKPAQPAPTAKIPKTSHNIAEVAFKMTDGSTVRKEFQPNDTVQDLYNFVKQNSSLRSFELSTSFPRKVLGAHDMNKTLLECDLVPNGTIMVMSFDTAPSHSSPSLATAGLMDTAYNYWSWMYSGVTGWIWGSALPPNSHMQQSNGPQPISASRQPPSPTNTTQRRNGPRIGTLGSLSSDDPDKNSYWNGNSTQQQ